MRVIVVVRKWGDSVAISLPKAVLSSANIAIGDRVMVSVKSDGKLEVTREEQ